MRENWGCVGLRTKLEKLRQIRCFQSHVLAGTVSKFESVEADKSRMICSQLELQYVGVATVEFTFPFRLTVNVEAIQANGNSVFISTLYGIGANSKSHGKLKEAVFSHMEEKGVQASLRGKYGESFDECVQHRS